VRTSVIPRQPLAHAGRLSLYCDKYPRAIEISLYDPNLLELERQLPSKHGRQQLMAAIAPLWRPCVCGGRYRDETTRRCFRCHAEVIVDAPAGVDLSPYIGAEDRSRDPTEAEQETFDAFIREFVRTEELWL
jgi:hypothetical protein